MPVSNRENDLRTIKMTNPEWMPYDIRLCNLSWEILRKDLEDVVVRHPRSWPGFQRGSIDWNNLKFKPDEDPDYGDYTDSWGCVWRTLSKGIVGGVIKHPLADLKNFDSFSSPDPDQCTHMRKINWQEYRELMSEIKAAGKLACGGVDHGFHLLRLEYLRGFENLIFDMVEEPPEFSKLVEMVHQFNKELVNRFIDNGTELVRLPEDQGSQQGSLIGPSLFAKWVKPYLKELHDLVHSRGCLSHFHCDGNIMDIADQILEIGPDVFNPQDQANGIENLAAAFKGRLCFYLDFDRQHAIPFGTRKEIEDLVEYEVKTLGSANGGLKITCEVRGEIPPENIDALASALEKYSTYWFE